MVFMVDTGGTTPAPGGRTTWQTGGSTSRPTGGYKRPSTLAPSAKPGSPAASNSRYRPTYGEPPSRSPSSRNRGRAVTHYPYSREEAEAYYGAGGIMAVDPDTNPAVYYGPGGTLVYPDNYRNPIFMGLGDAEGKDTGLIVSMYPKPGEEYPRSGISGMQYAAGFEANLPLTMGWSDSEVDEFRRLAAFIRPFYPTIFDEPLGQQGVNDWGRMEGDLQAARWLGGLANSRNTDIMTAARELAYEIENDNIVPYDVLADLQGLDSGGTGSTREFDLLTKRVDTQISLSSFDRARQFLAAEMRDLLGRDPSKQEISQYLSTLNSLERANPTIVTREYTYDEERYGAEPTETTVTTEPGEVDTEGSAFTSALEGNEGEAIDFGLGRVRRLLNEMVGL